MDIKYETASSTADLIRRMSCHASLALASIIFGVTAFDIIQNTRSVANIQSWCAVNGCINAPKQFGSSQMTLPAAKLSEANRVIGKWDTKPVSALNARPAVTPTLIPPIEAVQKTAKGV